MVNKVFKFFLFLFGSLFVVFLTLLIFLMIRSPYLSSGRGASRTEKSYHYAFYLPNSNSPFFHQLKAGALEAAETMDCALSFHVIDSNSLNLEMVPYTGVDGLVVYLYRRDEDVIEKLIRITEANIPIVQIENEIFLDEATFYIGTNSFESGKAIGTLALESDKEILNVVIIYSEKNPGLMSDGNLIEMGMKMVLEERFGSLHTMRSSLNPLDAERLTYEILETTLPVDLIVLTDPSDTLVTVQTIVDLNLVGQIGIIGFGEDEAIGKYIDKGIILGTIVRNPHRMGFSAVVALKEISLNGYTSVYVDAGLNIITDKEGGE